MTENASSDHSGDNKKSVGNLDQSLGSQSKKTVSRAFWASIIFMAFLSIALAIIGSLRLPSTDSPPAPMEADQTVLERIFSEAAKEAYNAVLPDISLADVYAPVYAAIPVYTNFHYSFYGEYVELGQAALGEMDAKLNETLFDGFGARLDRKTKLLDQQFAEAYINALQDRLYQEFPDDTLLGPATEAAIEGSIRRVKFTVPIASVSSVMAGRLATKVIAKKIAARVAAKAAMKGGGKIAAVLTGGSAGALVCAWTGPVAVVCGAGAGIATWFAVDAVIINLDEYFNRDEFEADLRQLIDDDREAREQLLMEAWKEKGRQMDDAVKDFTMRDISE